MSLSLCSSSPPSRCRNWLDVGGEEGGRGNGGDGVHVGRVDPCAEVGPIKSVAGWERASDRPRSGADRDARHGAHFPGADLRPAAQPVRP